MPKKSNRTYRREFKLEAIRLYENTEMSMAAVERELGITPYLRRNGSSSFARKISRLFRAKAG